MFETAAFSMAVGAIVYVMYWLWVNDDGPGARPAEKFTLDNQASRGEDDSA